MIIKEFLSADECAQLIELSEKHGYEAAMVNTGGGRQKMVTDVRRSSRAIIDSPAAAQLLHERLKPILAKHCLEHGPKGGGWRLCTGPNERLRFLKYEPGDYFKPHSDGRYVRAHNDPRGAGDESLMTMMLYLNEPDRGGETNFFSNGRPRAIRPETGMCLIFDHDLMHEGALLKQGRKYAIRTDIMYSRRIEVEVKDQDQKANRKPYLSSGDGGADDGAAGEDDDDLR